MKAQLSAQEQAFLLLVQTCQTRQIVPGRRDNPKASIRDRKLLNDIDLDRSQAIVHQAFEEIDDYKTIKKRKKSGGYRIINEPPPSLKILQRKILLQFLYRILKRSEYYDPSEPYFGTKALRGRKKKLKQVFYVDPLEYTIDSHIHGSMKGRSTKTAIQTHNGQSEYPRLLPRYVLKMDFKSAYPSVRIDTVRKILSEMVTADCKGAFITYKRTSFIKERHELVWLIKEFAGKIPGKKNPEALQEWKTRVRHWLYDHGYHETVKPEELQQLRTKTHSVYRHVGYGEFEKVSQLKLLFPKYSFFPTYRYPEFRAFIREESKRCKTFEESQIPEIIDYFTSWMARIFCHNDVLPQGAPASGFLLNLVVSRTGLMKKIDELKEVDKVSIYVDDIIMTSHGRFTPEKIQKVLQLVQGTGIFTVNPKKTLTYDLKRGSAPILGGKLVYRKLNSVEVEYLSDSNKVARQALDEGKGWYRTCVTLSKKKQKQYRAFLYKISQGRGTDEEIKIAHGYFGHLMAIYARYPHSMPSSLRKVVEECRMFLQENGYIRRTW